MAEHTRAAVYERSIRASVERIWENVLDWEHLPWLHRTSFSDVRMLDASRGGWRAWVASRSRGSIESLVDVRLERAALRYVTRTLAGRCVNGHRFPLGPLPRVSLDPVRGDAALYW
jgi:hypothetical protein